MSFLAVCIVIITLFVHQVEMWRRFDEDPKVFFSLNKVDQALLRLETVPYWAVSFGSIFILAIVVGSLKVVGLILAAAIGAVALLDFVKVRKA